MLREQKLGSEARVMSTEYVHTAHVGGVWEARKSRQAGQPGDQLGFSHCYANWCIMAIPQAVDKSSSGQTSTTNIITTDSGLLYLPVTSP